MKTSSPPTIHLNQECRVTLRDRGVAAWQQHYASIRDRYPDTYHKQSGDVVTLSLWQVMEIFGPVTSIASESPIESNIEMLPFD